MRTLATWHAETARCRLVLGLVVVRAGILPAAGNAQHPVTFSQNISPILQRSCETCHRPGSIAPMSLITYEDVRPWARAIKDKTSRSDDDPDRMPPWFSEKNIGIQDFKDDISLSRDEINRIARWVDSGAPRGNPADLPSPRDWPTGGDWSFGEPDLVVSSPDHVLEAVAADWYGLLESSPTGLSEDRWVQAVEVREVLLEDVTKERDSGDLSLFVLHHAVISARPRTKNIQTQATTVRREPSTGGGERVPGVFSLVHKVGQNATHYPDSLGVKLPAEAAINWDLHLHSFGQEVPFRIDVAFKFHPKGWEPKYTGQGGIVSYLTFDIDIPPEDPNATMEGLQRVTRPDMLMTFEPHLHSSGRRTCIEAIYPTGFSEMLNCAGYNHNWVKVYVYDEDVAPLLPEGTLLRVTAWYDNTLSNPRVSDPRNWKGYGNRSTDDMFLNLSRFVPVTETQYQEELERRAARRRSWRRPRVSPRHRWSTAPDKMSLPPSTVGQSDLTAPSISGSGTSTVTGTRFRMYPWGRTTASSRVISTRISPRHFNRAATALSSRSTCRLILENAKSRGR